MKPLVPILRYRARQVLDQVLPPRCAACGDATLEGGFCAVCFGKLTFLTDPICGCCGYPFASGGFARLEMLCAACMARPPKLERLRSALVYDDASRPLILAFKHGDRTDSAPALARLLLAPLAELSGQATLLPVPLHWRRQWRRRYNQAGLLAAALGGLAGRGVDHHLLLRKRATSSQGTRDGAGRWRNVRNAFQVARPAACVNRRFVLVDDVVTTGATLDACAHALLQAGAAAVEAVSLARVIRTDGPV